MRGRRRCRLHGGKSTGARTPAGRARAAAANLRHGGYGRGIMELRAALKRGRAEAEALVARLLHEAAAAADAAAGTTGIGDRP